MKEVTNAFIFHCMLMNFDEEQIINILKETILEVYGDVD